MLNAMGEYRLNRGVLIQLPRDEAKDFFACKTDESVLEFVKKMLGDGQVATLDVEGMWPVIAESFGDDPPLAWCFLGGRPMYQHGDYQLILIRPDMVGHVAHALDEPAWTELADWTEEETRMIQAIRNHYRAAAESQHAMIFAVQP